MNVREFSNFVEKSWLKSGNFQDNQTVGLNSQNKGTDVFLLPLTVVARNSLDKECGIL